MQLFNKDELNKELDPIDTSYSSVCSKTSLPVLDALLAKACKDGKSGILNKTAVFYVHHPLKTSINVIDALIHLGAKPEHLFVLGKRYSECESVVSALVQKGVHYQPCSMQTGIGQYSYSFIRDINWLWAKVVEKLDAQVEQILIMDHGGHAITYLPLMLLEHYKIIGIEKTTAGFINSKKQGLPPIPVIDVANSAAKRFLESPLIADAVVNKIVSYLPENINDFVFGVVGLGSIGKAVVNRLHQLGCRLVVHDIDSAQQVFIDNKKNIIFTNEMSALIASADYIFGCSGRDISEGQLEQLRLATRNKTLISCSSEDKEYLSLLQMINQQAPALFDPMDDIEFKTELGASIHLIRGGFPVNFDQTGESVPANDIQLTRSLVLAAVLQASDYLNNTPKECGVYALDAAYQRFVIYEWFKHQDESRFDSEQLSCFLDEDWLANHSNGLNSMAIQRIS
ncbi:S-adenosyl-L-homocysteine hydrolase [Legionella pneumophila]|uniref:NAD(P)-dependent oxidoreductase n=1 Tax=Legionella pneumophila TaxID=446 RepID=UPI0007707C04|nr:NAD(P)-dependent oxidoreductase [Legionella pneumophila]HAT9215926.1 hypothetical protein [Legionella pneumophila subsp. pneumophila]CZP91414.1 S-adenosyl-L-homocysteine hydrolase [Legionella pneumophila]CZP94498.1 S-adenosyl-L-homocysteine hydrolase [Legionella pneumophila]CZP97247.1 S-adenosyl-L-homocysteine hydrolase [Legionella pneumophila]CZQ03737.1 S-adenosyl-L-homocysteine hydrolase [Legionella pneumophila]